MEKIAQSQLLDEQALYSLEENLSTLQARQRRLKDELTTVERLVSEAVAEQTRLRSSIATHKSLLSYSPVRSLPGEVLSEIFLHYISLSQSAHRDVFQEIVASHRIHTPILQVCRRWRTTALADPRLWTTIPLMGSGTVSDDDDDDDEDEDDEQSNNDEKSFIHPLISGSPEEKAAYWKALEGRIERTSALPLNLLFHFIGDDDTGDPIYSISSIQTFIRLFPRASSISLSIRYPKRSIPELISIIDNAEISEANQLHTAWVNILGDDMLTRKILSAIPNVEVLELGSVDVDRWFIDVPTAGHRLRSLHLLTRWSTISLVNLLNLLDRAPLLETLKVGRISITPSVGTRPVVTHTVLSTFHISSVEKEENNAIFGHLTLPALRSLSYEGGYQPEFWPCSSNMAFFWRSGCMLTELAFRQCQVDEKRLSKLLTAQKAIVKLRVNHFPDDDDGDRVPIPMSILDLLSTKAKGSSDRPLPALEVVSAVILPRQLKAAKRLIESRSANTAKKHRIATLREVAIQVNTKQRGKDIKKEEHAALFKAFMNKGIVVRVSYEYC